MVYESDFYTTRRPYRPSSYSVTSVPLRYIPTYGKVHTTSAFYPTRGPVVGQRRIIMSRAAPHSVVTIRVRPSVVIRELDRIEHRPRISHSYSASEDYLRSNASKDWEDESRKIRAQSNSLLQRIQTSTPRATSLVPYTTISKYSAFHDESFNTMDDYFHRLMAPISKVARDITRMSWYAEPAKKLTGRGHLSCLRFSGAKAFPNRKTLYHEPSIRDDVNLLSFYAKNRLAAAGLALESVTAANDLKEQPALVECS